jgi:hypothetical protein
MDVVGLKMPAEVAMLFKIALHALNKAAAFGTEILAKMTLVAY